MKKYTKMLKQQKFAVICSAIWSLNGKLEERELSDVLFFLLVFDLFSNQAEPMNRGSFSLTSKFLQSFSVHIV